MQDGIDHCPSRSAERRPSLGAPARIDDKRGTEDRHEGEREQPGKRTARAGGGGAHLNDRGGAFPARTGGECRGRCSRLAVAGVDRPVRSAPGAGVFHPVCPALWHTDQRGYHLAVGRLRRRVLDVASLIAARRRRLDRWTRCETYWRCWRRSARRCRGDESSPLACPCSGWRGVPRRPWSPIGNGSPRC